MNISESKSHEVPSVQETSRTKKARTDDIVTTKFPTTLVIMHLVSSCHTQRVFPYLEDMYNVHKADENNTNKELIFVDPTQTTAKSKDGKDQEPHARFLSAAYEDVFLLKFVHRFYVCEYKSNSITVTDSVLDMQGKHIRVMCFPSQIYDSIGQLSLKGISLRPTNFTHFLSAVSANNHYYFGLSEAELFYVKDNDKLKAFAEQGPCRAGHKMAESIQRFGLQVKPNWMCIDIGAAPGGISLYLSELVPDGIVVAVDPAELNVDMPPNMIHLKSKIELVLDDLIKIDKEGKGFDLIMCDINNSAHEVLPIIQPLVNKLLKVGGTFLFTCKLAKRRESSKSVEKYMARCTEYFHANYSTFDNVRVKWLLSNRNERTLVATRIS